MSLMEPASYGNRTSLNRENAVDRASDGMQTKVRTISRLSARHAEGFHVNGNTEQKNKQRADIATFFKQALPRDRHTVMFSLPGESWSLEQDLAAHFPGIWFVGCEQDVRTWERSRWYMPGGRVGLMKWRLTPPGRHIDAWSNGRATLFRIESAMFLMHSRPMTWKKRSNWVKYHMYHCAWLDTFSPFGCDSFLIQVRGIFRRIRKGDTAAAFSFVLGRDQPHLHQMISLAPGRSPLEKRANFLKELASHANITLTVEGMMSHKSWNPDGFLRMGTVLVKMRRKRKDT